MQPQSPFMIVASIRCDREAALCALLDNMNGQPGIANPKNQVLPFGLFDNLHFARFVVLRDPTLSDLAEYGLPIPRYPAYLAFLGDCDGPPETLYREMIRSCQSGLTQIFAHCEDFEAGDDVFAWMRSHERRCAAYYINTRGRTVRQIREEAALQRAMSRALAGKPIQGLADAQSRRRALLGFVATELAAGRLVLTPAAPTPWRWWLGNLVNLIVVPAVALVCLPLALLSAPIAILMLRRNEEADPEICPRPSEQSLLELQRIEDLDVTNQYTAVGSIKPGWFRLGLLRLLLMATDYACRHVYMRGYLARVQTIHCARWVFIDSGRRMVFASNYDGRHEAYMDDFINKVGWGLNLLFSNGVGWPKTQWLVRGGAKLEMPFKYFQRRHQLPTQVWYKAYPGLVLNDLRRNARIRQGIERRHMSDAQALAWLRLL